VTKRQNWENKSPPFHSLLNFNINHPFVYSANLIWSTIILLKVLYNPFVPIKDEIYFYQNELSKTPQIYKIINNVSTLPDRAPEQPIKGKSVFRIGVKSCCFCEASLVEQILKNISNLQPPEFNNS
jgi:hypothetical protein